VSLRFASCTCGKAAFLTALSRLLVGLVFMITAHSLAAQSQEHVPQGVVSDWTHKHVVFPDSKDESEMAEARKDPRWVHDWNLRHRDTWWRGRNRRPPETEDTGSRDWNVALAPAVPTFGFEPIFDFTFTIGTQAGFGSLNTSDQTGGKFLATAGSLTVTGAADIGNYSLHAGGPAVTTSPGGGFVYDNLLHPTYPTLNPSLDVDGILFTNAAAFEVNLWGNGVNAYEYDDKGYVTDRTGNPFTLTTAPGGGQTFPAKYVFDIKAAPSCANDFVAIGMPVNPAPAGQANIIGYNNLYSSQTLPAPVPAPFCATVGPTVKFAYASGTGQIPASLTLSQNGTQLAYVETLPTGSSYFHILTIGTTGTNGTSATAAVVPGATGGNNAVDRRVLLSPDGGVTNQPSTNAPWVSYTTNDANDVAYVTTYSKAGAGSGYMYKLTNVFNGSAPTIVWSAAITAVPSAPVYDMASNRVFFTDSSGRIDYVIDSGASPAPVYGAILAAGNTSEYPITLDTTHHFVYASFDTNGTNALIVQAPTTLASSVSVPVGSSTVTYTGPYGVDFNNAWHTGVGTPLLYVAGTGTGALPTLYGIGFIAATGLLNASAVTTTPLATGIADESPVTEFYNPLLNKDYLFVGVTNHCVATTLGGAAGCVMSLDITAGFPTVNAATTALAASGGTTGIIVDNDSNLVQAASIYYATKTGATLVKATQSALK